MTHQLHNYREGRLAGPCVRGRRHVVACLLACLLGGPFGSVASAQIAEEGRQMPTDAAATDLFPLNPAVLKPASLHGGLLLLRDERTSILDHEDAENPGDKITSKAKDDHAVVAVSADLGAGAGIAVSHEVLFRSVETELASQAGFREPSLERMKQQHSALKLTVELTTELRAGMAIRYLYKDVTILGDPFLAQTETTEYKSTMIGYGSGFAYYHGTVGGLSYTYFPPLRGKTEVYGEELIVVEPGFISVDAFYAPDARWRFGLAGKRWLQEVDDRAAGTTADDDETDISLHGLDVDQYVFKTRLIMLGLDFSLSQDTIFKAAIGQETAELNFRDLAQYNRVDVRQGDEQAHEQMKYNRLRVALRFGNQTTELQAGAGMFSRSHDFPSAMNGGRYESSGKEVFASVGMKL